MEQCNLLAAFQRGHISHFRETLIKFVSSPPAGRGYQNLLRQVVPVVDVHDLLVGPREGSWRVQLPEGACACCNVGIMKQPLVVRSLPAALVQCIQGHPAPFVCVGYVSPVMCWVQSVIKTASPPRLPLHPLEAIPHNCFVGCCGGRACVQLGSFFCCLLYLHEGT